MKASGYFLLFVLTQTMYAQDWQLIKRLSLDEQVSAFDADPQGNLYLGTSSGNVLKYQSDLSSPELYSDLANFPVSSIAAWNRLRVFLFFQDEQQFTFIDRFAAQAKPNELREFTEDLIWRCTPGTDNSLWVLSTAYHELRKYNLQTGTLLTALPLHQDLEQVSDLRAHQNFVLLADGEKGIFIFDQYANLLRTVEISGIKHVQVRNEEVVFLAQGFVHRVGLFGDESSHQKLKAPEGAFSGVLDLVGNYAFIGTSEVQLYAPR